MQQNGLPTVSLGDVEVLAIIILDLRFRRT